MLILFIIVFLIIGLFELKTILKGKSRKTYIIYFSLLLIGFAINLLLVLDKAPVNNPIKIIEKVVKFFI
jgi:hypothetical protein